MTGPVGVVGTPPSHYATSSGIGPFQVIDEYDLGFYAGNALKYIVRAPKKGDFQGDLKKAIHYLQEATNRLPHRDGEWIWEAVPWIAPELESEKVIQAFEIEEGPRLTALHAILEAATTEDTELVEHLYWIAITSLERLI